MSSTTEEPRATPLSNEQHFHPPMTSSPFSHEQQISIHEQRRALKRNTSIQP
jgi:hypothetical protein